MKKIIVVDDSRTVRQQVRLVLTQAGFDVIEATDGLEGLTAVEETPDAAVVLCDVNMPRMDGLEMLETLQRSAQSRPPVLILTTEGHPDLLARAKRAGAKGWMVKPFKADILLAAVHKLAG